MKKFMLAELCKRTGLHRNTIYNLLQRGVIEPVEIINRLKVYSEETVEQINEYYESRSRAKHTTEGSE